MTNAAAKIPARILATCDKCEGKGSIYGFSHYAAGVCFDCSGNGTRYVTAHEAKVTAEQAERMAAAKVENDKRAVFIARFDGVEPRLVAGWFAKMDADKVSAIRQHSAPMPGHDDAPGARVCYWAASTVLNAWPSGRAYPESWVYAA